MFRPALVGRDPLLAAIEVVLAASRGGVAVTGAPGSGVTRVLLEVHAAHAGLGRTVAFCRPPDSPPTRADRDADLVVVDDAHLSDAETIGVLRELALHTSVVIGVRPQLAPSGLAWLWQSGVLERIDVPELTPSDTAALVRAVDTSIELHPATFAMLHEQCAGRAGLVVDGVRGIRRARELPGGPAWWRALPAAACCIDLADRATTALAQLDAEGRELVEQLAVAGPVPRHAIADTSVVDRLSPTWLVTGADGLVHVLPPVMVTTIRGLLPPERHHVLAATAIAQWAEVLRPFDRIRLEPDSAPPALLVDATAAAQRAGDLVSALELADRLVALDTIEARTTRAEVLDAIGQRREAADLYRAIATDPATPAMNRAVAAFEQSTILLWDLGDPHEATVVASSILREAADTPFECYAAALAGSIALYRGRSAEAAVAAREALDECHPDDPGWFPWSHVLVTARAVTSADDGLDEGERAHLSAILALTPPASALWASQFVALSLALELGGRLDDARRLLQTHIDEAGRSRTATATAWLSLARSRVELAAGKVNDAAEWATQASVGFLDARHPTGLRWATGARLLAAGMADDHAACRRILADLDGMEDSAVRFLDSEVQRARAWALVACGERRSGLAALRAAADTAEQFGASALAITALHDLARLGAPDHERIRTLASHTALGADHVICRHSSAICSSDAAALVEVATQLADEGRLLVAAETATAASSAAKAAGLRSTRRDAADRAFHWRSECGGARTPALADGVSATLSPRERDVAALAARGSSSKEIGASLALSSRTVDNLLQRAYAKLGVSSRRDLAMRLKPTPRRNDHP